MNLDYLGDALDHWKGSIFEGLQRDGVLKDFIVDQMATDARLWKPVDSELFVRLLRIKRFQLVSHNHDLCEDRAGYFAEISSKGDLFLDPNTGIKTGSVNRIADYIMPAELIAAMHKDSNRVVIVYQHIRAKKTRERVAEVLAALKKKDKHFYCVSYESGTVALLFLSRSDSRVRIIREYFDQLLGAHAKNRIGHWNGDMV